MATKKAGGTAKNLTDSKPKYLGIKLAGGQSAKPGAIIVRQRGTRYMAGKNVGLGKDHTLFSLASGIVSFKDKRKVRFDGSTTTRKVVDVDPA
jgi:large subunit ribosomal protein L27